MEQQIIKAHSIKTKKEMIGIMGAMQEEINHLLVQLKDTKTATWGRRTYYQGILFGQPVVIVFSRWGKVAAATTATTLLLEFKVTQLIFTGVAGAINHTLKIGDIVIADKIFQHDMDARPLIKKYEIPLLGKMFFEAEKDIQKQAKIAAEKFLKHINNLIPSKDLKAFNIEAPKVIIGNIASGDQFIASDADRGLIEKGLPDIACVEMEGSAVAQVCYEFGVPYTIIRTISDAADEHSDMNFTKFIASIASNYSEGIIRALFTTDEK